MLVRPVEHRKEKQFGRKSQEADFMEKAMQITKPNYVSDFDHTTIPSAIEITLKIKEDLEESLPILSLEEFYQTYIQEGGKDVNVSKEEQKNSDICKKE
jgi:hypothetical protein